MIWSSRDKTIAYLPRDWSLDHHDLSCREIVDSAGDLDLSGLGGGSDDRAEGVETVDPAFHVGADGVLELVAGEILACGYGGLDGVDEVVDRAGQSVFVVQVLDCGLDGSALGVAENHDERDAEFGDRVLNGAFDRGASAVDVVAGDADDEELPDAEVKENLRGHTGVCASDDAGDGVLARGERLEVGGSAPRVCGCT